MLPTQPENSPLPYQDTKPQGAADFYFAINATFRFINKRLGAEGLQRYWQELGRDYMKPVWQNWRSGGLTALATYWKAFFAAEPGALVEVSEMENSVRIEVERCPAIAHLRSSNREIFPGFCRHCFFVSDAAAQQAGYTVRVQGGNGQCRQEFFPLETAPAPQDLSAIAEAA